MKVFRQALAEIQGGSNGSKGPGNQGRTWVYVPYDQLTDAFGPLAQAAPETLGVVLLEHPGKAARRPYHKQKLALILANQRHFALEQARRGVALRYEVVDAESSYAATLERLSKDLGPLRVMEPAERELREELEPAVRSGRLAKVPHEGWLTTAEQFVESQAGATPYRMDAFYRHVRRATGLLMDKGKPEGGKFSFDAENRKPWKGDPATPRFPTFRPDAVTKEVGDLIESRFAHHPGVLNLEALPATQADAEALWAWAKKKALPHFGPFEDAMAKGERRLFHACISPVLNLSRLSPRRIVEEVAASALPLATREGFVRQILGWREFVRHVHRQTDGFRKVAGAQEVSSPRHAGYEAWAGKPWVAGATPSLGVEGTFPVQTMGVPPAYWGTPSGLACLDDVVEGVWQDAYSHHITRLMVLSNIATLLEISPRELSDWFWVAYADAYDWVVEPNVLAMGTYAFGDLATTKPYVSGAGYIHRMSNYCGGCAFDPKTTCPLTPLYWAYLERHREGLEGNQRMSLPLATLRKRSPAEKANDLKIFETTRQTLAAGKRLRP